MSKRSWLVFSSAYVLLSSTGCQSHLPPIQTVPYTGHVTPADISADINCELATIVYVTRQIDPKTKKEMPVGDAVANAINDPKYKTRSDAYRRTLKRLKDLVDTSSAPTKTDADMSKLLKHLIDDHFVAAVQLTLDVTDSEGFAPSLNKVSPYLTASNNRTLSLGGQLNGTQDRNITLTNSVDFEALVVKDTWDPVETYCKKSSPSTMAALGTATGLNGALLGDLGLADIVVDGLRGLDDSSKVNLYGGTGPVRPAETATVQFDLDHVSLTQGQDRNPKISSGSLDGTVTFTPPAAGTYAPETATLVGVLKLKDAINAQVISYLVNVPGTVIPEPPDRDAIRPDASKRVRVSFQGALSADTVTNISHTPGTAPALVLVGTSDTGKLSGLTLKGQITASPTPTNLTSYSFDASVPSNANGLPAILFQRSYSLQGFNVPSYLTNALVAAPAATAAPSPGGGSKAGSAGGASSNGSSSFGSTVNFSLAYGLNGGANWTLTHFKGPSPSSPLFTGSRTETNTLNITFVPACRKTNPKEDIDLIAPKLSDFWSILSPCDADNVNVGNAAAAANQLNLLLRLH